MYRIFNSSVVLIVMMLAGCGVKEELPEGVVHHTEIKTKAGIGEIRKEIYLKDSKPYQEFGFYKDGKRFFESYAGNLDTIEFTHSIEFYPSGELKKLETSESDKNELMSAYWYYPNGILQLRHNGETHLEEVWDASGAKQTEYYVPNSDIKKITNWYHNGQIKEESELLNAQRNGKWFEWDSLGHETRKEFYVNGKLKK
jgi:antitoxin component YwqK of YwqJK toxin-antitoxin module